MERNVNARVEAIKEISREKARIFRKGTETLSSLEQIAIVWKKKKETQEYQRQQETPSAEEPSFRETLAKGIVDHDKQKLRISPALPTDGRAGGADVEGWVQYKPSRKEGEKDKDEEQKEMSLNTATVVSIRKKLITAEWRRALGKPQQDNRRQDLEQEAVVWRQRKMEVERRKEEIRIKIERHKQVLSEALAEFGKQLREKELDMDPKELTTLLEKSLETAGEVFDIEWQEDNCLIWIEPWEEKKMRKISGFDIPVLYRVKIDENFEIASFEEVEDEEIIESLREEILTKPFKESLEGVFFDMDSEDEAGKFLEDKLSEIGRLISLERTQYGWFASIEPWEEMRSRNLKRGGKPPIVTDEIEIDWKDGKLEFVTEESKEEQNDECMPKEDDEGQEEEVIFAEGRSSGGKEENVNTKKKGRKDERD